jgi:predicted negative regulator of RcsB-dependent stress response
MAGATQTPTQQELEQTLNKTDFGHVLYENRKLIFAALVAVLLGVSVWLLWKQQKQASARDAAQEVFTFQSKTWAEAKEGKLPAADLARAFEGLPKSVQTSGTMLPLVLEMGKFLQEKGALAEADAILGRAAEVRHHSVADFFLALQRAVILEQLGQTERAVSVWEELQARKEVFYPAKVALELGRLYMKQGEKGKAQSQFENIISQWPNEDYARVAKLYLSQLAQ